MVAWFKLYVRGGHVVKQWNKTMESGFLCGFNGFQLVHSMCWVKRGSLPLGLAHDGCVCCLSFGVFHYGSAQGRNHGGDLQTVRYVHVGFSMLAHWFGLTFAQSYFSSLVWILFCKCWKGMRSSLALLLWAPNVFTYGHDKPVSKILLSTFRPSWDDCT